MRPPDPCLKPTRILREEWLSALRAPCISEIVGLCHLANIFRCIPVVACLRAFFFLWLNNIPLWIEHILLVHSSISDHLGGSHLWLLWILLLSTWVCKYLSVLLFISLFSLPCLPFLGHDNRRGVDNSTQN